MTINPLSYIHHMPKPQFVHGSNKKDYTLSDTRPTRIEEETLFKVKQGYIAGCLYNHDLDVTNAINTWFKTNNYVRIENSNVFALAEDITEITELSKADLKRIEKNRRAKSDSAMVKHFYLHDLEHALDIAGFRIEREKYITTKSSATLTDIMKRGWDISNKPNTLDEFAKGMQKAIQELLDPIFESLGLTYSLSRRTRKWQANSRLVSMQSVKPIYTTEKNNALYKN